MFIKFIYYFILAKIHMSDPFKCLLPFFSQTGHVCWVPVQWLIGHTPPRLQLESRDVEGLNSWQQASE